MKKFKWTSLSIVCAMLFFCNAYLCAEDNAPNPSDLIIVNGKTIDPASLKTASYFQKGSLRSEIESEARRLAEEGFFDKAILRYRDALHPALIEDEVNKSMALFGILQIHQWQGKFELALEELQWFLMARPDKDYYIDKKFELEALIKARDTGSNQPVYEFIESMQKKWASLLPPKGSNTYTDSVLSPILQLYEYMGDYDSGMAYVDEILDYEYNRTKIKKVFTSAEADQRMQDLQQRRERGWQDYKAIRDWLRIREGFEQDKREGTKGRALRAILDSDIIPW